MVSNAHPTWLYWHPAQLEEPQYDGGGEKSAFEPIQE